MKKTILKRNTSSMMKHGRITCCILLIFALLLTGCSTASSPKKDTASNDQPSPEVSETPESSSSEDTAESDNPLFEDSENLTEEDFDFFQLPILRVPEPAAGETPRILFVGNSHTFTNDLPGIFSELTAAMGHVCDIQELSEGYYTLTQFADTTDELGAVLNQKLTDENWDFVVLQENTNDAFSFSEENMLPAAAALDEKIQAAGGQTVLLMTWTPKEGASIMGPEQVQTILAQNTIAVSDQLESLLIPGGVAFMRCLEQYPQIELWAEDGMHPSLEGSYLAACVAYTVIFQESPVGCTYTAELDGETAAQLQELAAGFLGE